MVGQLNTGKLGDTASRLLRNTPLLAGITSSLVVIADDVINVWFPVPLFGKIFFGSPSNPRKI